MKPDVENAESTAESTIEALPEAVQDRLACILDDYLVAAELGSPISPEDLLARHPEDADHLRSYLSGLKLFHAAAVAPKVPQPITLVGGNLKPEQTVGDFRLVGEIGRGGMGVVYEAEQISLRRRVALKILSFTAAHDEKQISRFQNEAQAAAQIKHPNIVPVFAVGEQNGVHYYAMQLVEGQSLATLLAETRRGPAPSAGGTSDHVRAIARLGVQAAKALHAAHEYGIVHRDVKPSNLLVDDQSKLWVTDFGLARCRENVGLTQTGDVLGTMRYMSPEQALGRSGLIDHRTDVYSLGVTLYELSTLHHPAGDSSDAQLLFDRNRFVSKPLRFWNRHIPVDFQTIVLKAIAEFPYERYATAQEFAEDLNRFLEGQPILASPPSLVNRAGKWARRHRSLVYAVTAMLLLAFVGQWVSTVMIWQEKAEAERARAISQAHLRQAHTVLNRFGSQLVDELAAIPGAEGVRYQLLNDSLDLYQQFETQVAGEASLADDRALAYSKIGSLSEKLGKNEEALQNHVAARDLWQARVADEPSNQEAVRNLALCQNNLGLLLGELGRSAEAFAAYEQAQRLQQTLLKQHADSEPIAGDLATTYSNLGLALQQVGRHQAAQQKFDDAIAILKPLAAKSPENESVLRGLAACYNNLGSLSDNLSSERVAHVYHEAIRIQKLLVARYPDNRLYQGDLARSYNNLGFTLAHQQDWRKAELCYLDAVRIQKHLVEKSPLAASYRRDLAISFNNLGMVQSRVERFVEAEESFHNALQLQRLLLTVEPSDAQALSNLGGVYNNLGLLFDQQQQFADAESNYQQAVQFQKQAFEASPGISRYRDLLSNHYANYAKCLESQQKLVAAREISAERKSLLAGQPKAHHLD